MSFSVSTIVCISVSMVLCIALPVAAALYLKKKFGTHKLAFWSGCVIFLVFAYLIEGVLNTLIMNLPFYEKINNSLFLYALTGGLMAAACEEAGRYYAFRHIMKDKMVNDYDAMM